MSTVMADTSATPDGRLLESSLEVRSLLHTLRDHQRELVSNS